MLKIVTLWMKLQHFEFSIHPTLHMANRSVLFINKRRVAMNIPKLSSCIKYNNNLFQRTNPPITKFITQPVKMVNACSVE